MKPDMINKHNHFWYYRPSIIDPFTLIINSPYDQHQFFLSFVKIFIKRYFVIKRGYRIKVTKESNVEKV